LCAQIPKAQINTVKLSVFFALLGSARVKAAHKKLMKLTVGGAILLKDFMSDVKKLFEEIFFRKKFL